MRTAPLSQLFLALLGLVSLTLPASAKQPPVGQAPKPQQIYNQFRELMADGKFDIAANALQAFLDAKPTDADFLEIEKNYGSTAFTRLRTIPRWSDEPESDKQARANVEEAVKRAKAASEKLLRDPARVQKYIRNLAATFEERAFAAEELRRMGDFAIPFLVDELRITRDSDLRDGILSTIPKLDRPTMAGWIAALEGLSPDQQFGVVQAITTRDDIIAMQADAQTDLAPMLWRVMARPTGQSPTLSALSERLLNVLKPGTKAASRSPETELIQLANTFYERTARFDGAKSDPDGKTTVPIWVWDTTDPSSPKLKKMEDVPVGQAEEYYGLRYARWALERKPDYEPAQLLILALAAERAIQRANHGDLASAEPGIFKLLSDAPSPVLEDILSRSLTRKKTGLALAMVQVLGHRADKTSGPALVKALDYPDPAVQMAAANALLRSPVPTPPAVKGKIVDILRRAAGSEAGDPESKGTALIADPSRFRAGAVSVLFRGLGYEVEVFSSGRDLLRRVARSSDFDVLFIDQHTPNPELIDLIGQLQSNPRISNRPTFIVASSDTPRLPTFDQLLVRFSALIAATENRAVPMPAPFVPDSRMTTTEITTARRNNQENRDNQFRNTALQRIERLNRVIEATGVELTKTQRLLLDLRIELITLAVLGAEFPISPDSAPKITENIKSLRNQIALQPLSPRYGMGTPTADLLKLMERFEIDLDRVPDARKRFQSIYSKVDAVELGLPVETFRDAVAEARLARTFQKYPAIKIVPEPFGQSALAEDLQAAQTEPGLAPRSMATKQSDRKLAVEWLRKMATGELPGFDVKAAEPELRAALRSEELAEDAIPAVGRFGSADAQQALLSVALNIGKPLPLRTKAADEAIKHIQINGKATAQSLIDPIVEAASNEADVSLRGKFLTLKGLLDHKPDAFLDSIRGYNPPLIPPPPPEPEPKKEPEVKKNPNQ